VLATLLIPTLCFFLINEPVFMVKIGGVAQALMLPVIGFSTIYLDRTRMPRALRANGWTRLALWICSAIMLVAASYYVIRTVL
jgi:hypothetical protein